MGKRVCCEKMHWYKDPSYKYSNDILSKIQQNNKIMSHISKSLKGFKCGKLSTERKPKMHYTCVGSQENYYQKITCKREPLIYLDKDIHVQINQEDKLTFLGSELERTKHLNFFMSHTVKIAVENKKKNLVGYDLRRAKINEEFKKDIVSGTSLVEAKLITTI